jgi:hypothetical protein
MTMPGGLVRSGWDDDVILVAVVGAVAFVMFVHGVTFTSTGGLEKLVFTQLCASFTAERIARRLMRVTVNVKMASLLQVSKDRAS